jgi:hypothetical protein
MTTDTDLIFKNKTKDGQLGTFSVRFILDRERNFESLYSIHLLDETKLSHA